MPNSIDKETPYQKAFAVAVQIRNLEIELFWRRSLFFWGFIAAAFIGYATIRKDSASIAIAIACFGVVCSTAWTLLNRGSKYWQETWETKVERYESGNDVKLFSSDEHIQYHKGPWLRARKYSVSKLAIALSDYVLCLWTAFLVSDLLQFYFPDTSAKVSDWGPATFAVFSILYVFLIVVYARKSPRE